MTKLYVKITKGDGWYRDLKDSIFEVEDFKDRYHVTGYDDRLIQPYIKKENCEVINLINLDGPISEQLINKIWDLSAHAPSFDYFLDDCKKNGIVKTSREDELREEVANIENADRFDIDTICKILNKYKELIKILDEKS